MADQIEFLFLGKPRIRRGGRDLLEEIPSKGQALLAYLAVTRSQHSRSSLAGLLWGEMPEEVARTNLRLTLSRTRKAVGDCLQVSRQSAGLAAGYWLDVAEFEARAASAQSDLISATETLSLAQLQTAISLYRNDFLTDFSIADAAEFELWVLTTRAHLRQLALELFFTVASRARKSGNLPAAITAVRRLLVLEPWHEEAHQELMRLLAASGQRSAALAQYEICCRMLDEELGVEPAAATVALFEKIRSGQVSLQKTNEESLPESLSLHAGVSTPRHNLPRQLTPLIGRKPEMSQLVERLRQPRYHLLTLVGEGGVGKTRLALAVAEEMRAEFPDGVWFVPLAGVEVAGSTHDILTVENSVATAIASAMGLTFASKQEPRRELLSYLAPRSCLLILDNCEGLLTAGGLVIDLLMAAPGVTILVTSREPFHLQPEYIFRLEGLPVPPDAASAEAATFDSLQLFVECMERAGSRKFLTSDCLGDAVEICRFVNGLPLGIEIAAGWTRWLAPAEILVALRAHDASLELSFGDLPPRHRSMQIVFENSWQLLSGGEQTALAQLSVFLGAFRIEAAQAVTEMRPAVLFSLVDKSLVQRTANGAFLIHELLRGFAAHKLKMLSVDQEPLRDRHAVYYLDFMHRRTEAIQGREPRRAIEEIQTEADNVSQAWGWAARRPLPNALAHGLSALTIYWSALGLFRDAQRNLVEAIRHLENLAESNVCAPSLPLLLARLYAAHAAVLVDLGRMDEALSAAQQSTRLAENEMNVEAQATGYLQQGIALFYQGKYAAAHAALIQATHLLGESVPLRLAGSIQRSLAAVAWRQGDLKQARRNAEEALQCFRKAEDMRGEARSRYMLGIIALNQQRHADAWASVERALAQALACMDRQLTVGAYGILGQIASYRGQFEQALHDYEQERRLSQEIGYAYQVGINASNVGDMKLAMGDYEGAAAAYDEALEMFRSLNTPDHIPNVLAHYGLLQCQTGNYLAGEQMCREAVALAEAAEVQREQAFAWLFLAHNLAGQQRWDEAGVAYTTAWRLWQSVGDSRRAFEAQAGLAQTALATGNMDDAQAHVGSIVSYLQTGSLDGATDPARVYLTCFRVLQAAGDSRAVSLLQAARDLVESRASQIEDETRRQVFLEDVPAHRELMLCR